MNPQLTLGNHAVVIGGSIAGLMAARILSDHFAQVTILERDPVDATPQARKGQPQVRHLHALLAGGLDVMKAYFPGFEQTLEAAGAQIGDGEYLRWYGYGGYRMAGRQPAADRVVRAPARTGVAECHPARRNRRGSTADDGRQPPRHRCADRPPA